MWLSSASRCGAGGWGVWDGRSVGRGYRARTSSNVQAAADTHVEPVSVQYTAGGVCCIVTARLGTCVGAM